MHTSQSEDLGRLNALSGPAEAMLEVAERVESLLASGKLTMPPILPSWIRREVYAAMERHAHLIGAGVPDEAAAFLAQDDMGFQFANIAVEWFEHNLAG